MFRCCFPTVRGSGLRTARGQGRPCRWRFWRTPRLRRLWPFGSRLPQVTRDSPALATLETVEDLADGFAHRTSRHQEPEGQATNTIQGWSESGADLTVSLSEACGMRALQEGPAAAMAEFVVQGFPPGSIASSPTVTPTHPAFFTAQQALGPPTPRSCSSSIRSDAIKVFSPTGGVFSYSDAGYTPEDQVKRAIASMVGAWPDQVQDCGHPQLFPWFKLKPAFVQVNFPASHLVGHVHLLWVEVEHLEPSEAELEGLQNAPEPEAVPALGLERGPSVLALEPASPLSAPAAPERASPSPAAPGPDLEPDPHGPPAPRQIATTAGPGPSLEPDCPQAVTAEPLTRREKPNILSFPARLVAEQLTLMDVELFKMVAPHECLGSVWSQRAKPGNEHLASTVRATVTQFNSVVSFVMTTCLGDPGMKTQDIAKVVEFWIQVAKECRTLKNFSSLHAILSALQSVSIHRLKKTWGKVSRRSLVTYEKLRSQDNSLGREQLVQKRFSMLANLMRKNRGDEKRLPAKCVPFLGTFLTELEMLDTALEDYVEGNEINLKKKEKERKVMGEIAQLQEAAQKYQLGPEGPFGAWFQDMERLSEKASYILSCKLEPRG